uniref:Putative rho GDP-dissociation inhibitor 1-like n=1 Tax=Davidia involucrata TaxID=16924 RepID=A0A5B7B0U9_DAVIN
MWAVVGAISASKDNITFSSEMEKEEQKKKKKNNNANDEENGKNSDNEEEEEEDGTKLKSDKELDLGPLFSLKEQLEKDKDDESLRKWKEQLLGSVDFSAVGESKDPEVKILSLSILSPGRPDLVFPCPFASNSKASLFTLKEGSRYRLKFTFTVSNNIVSGLKYTNTVWKTGVRVDNSKVMLGTFSPQQELYTYELKEDTTPSGMFVRGLYSARTKVVDDDGKCYMDVNYCFEIQKKWPSHT